MANDSPDPLDVQIERIPLVCLSKMEELVIGGMDLALNSNQAVRADQRIRVVVGTAKHFAEAVADNDAVRPSLVVNHAEDAAVARLGEPEDFLASVVARHRKFREDDEVAPGANSTSSPPSPFRVSLPLPRFPSVKLGHQTLFSGGAAVNVPVSADHTA